MDLRDLIQFAEARNIFSRDDHILLAVSGGMDSTVMAHLFHRAKFRFAIAHCNFGLRGKESDEDAAFVKEMALHFNVPYFSEAFDTKNIALQKGISIQMAARDLRYDWFEKTREKNEYDYIATAHHLDDQVETFMINLIRGTGIAGLHGIPVKNDRVIRPLMFASRKDIEEYAGKYKISYRTDRSNNETKYLRNKIRHEVIPLLSSLNPEFTQGLTGTIVRISGFEQIGNRALEEWCQKAITTDGHDQFVDIRHLLELAPVEPYAWKLLSPFGFSQTQVSNLIGCLKKESSKVFCSPTHRLVKDRERLVIRPIEPKIRELYYKIGLFAHQKKIAKPLKLLLERIVNCEEYDIPANVDIASLDFDKLQFPLTLRRWQPGDVFFPLGMKKKKKLSDFFIDQKFSLQEKEQTWLLCSGKDIAWIVGRRIDHRFRVTPATREILRIVTRDA